MSKRKEYPTVVLAKHESISGVGTAELAAMLLRQLWRWQGTYVRRQCTTCARSIGCARGSLPLERCVVCDARSGETPW